MKIESKIITFYTEEDKSRKIKTELKDDEEAYRSSFWRDYARLLHSPTFRRLKGKTQLFPGVESDFYRNRLTHSLEVAQIGKSIANYVNWQLKQVYGSSERYRDNIDRKDSFIDTDLVEFACIAHDIGHPPFGHQGEEALDEQMKSYGGFEGNAQTLRLLAKLEKKVLPQSSADDITDYIIYKNQVDQRSGLNLTYRSLASILKYDKVIVSDDKGRTHVQKGYYELEKGLVQKIKKAVLNGVVLEYGQEFKTVECQIMDIADDIAYSIYDLEDAFKGGFFHPLELYSKSHDDIELLDKIIDKIKSKGSREEKGHLENISKEEVQQIITELFFNEVSDIIPLQETDPAKYLRLLNKMSNAIAKDGYYRTGFTSKMAGRFIHSVSIDLNETNPALSKINIDEESEKQIEILKHLTYEYQIVSPKLKAVEYKGKRIVTKIFERLIEDKLGEEYLPEDIRKIYKQAIGDQQKSRVVCDFIASMTDSYAIEFYSRLFSSTSISIHKPYH